MKIIIIPFILASIALLYNCVSSNTGTDNISNSESIDVTFLIRWSPSDYIKIHVNDTTYHLIIGDGLAIDENDKFIQQKSEYTQRLTEHQADHINCLIANIDRKPYYGDLDIVLGDDRPDAGLFINGILVYYTLHFDFTQSGKQEFVDESKALDSLIHYLIELLPFKIQLNCMEE